MVSFQQCSFLLNRYDRKWTAAVHCLVEREDIRNPQLRCVNSYLLALNEGAMRLNNTFVVDETLKYFWNSSTYS